METAAVILSVAFSGRGIIVLQSPRCVTQARAEILTFVSLFGARMAATPPRVYSVPRY